jgi:hypothetical protein
MVYSGPELLHLVFTFLVARSFRDRPKGSNAIEQPIVSGKLMNGVKIHNNVRCNKNIIKIKWSQENRVTYLGDRQNGSVANNNR